MQSSSSLQNSPLVLCTVPADQDWGSADETDQWPPTVLSLDAEALDNILAQPDVKAKLDKERKALDRGEVLCEYAPRNAIVKQKGSGKDEEYKVSKIEFLRSLEGTPKVLVHWPVPEETSTTRRVAPKRARYLNTPIARSTERDGEPGAKRIKQLEKELQEKTDANMVLTEENNRLRAMLDSNGSGMEEELQNSTGERFFTAGVTVIVDAKLAGICEKQRQFQESLEIKDRVVEELEKKLEKSQKDSIAALEEKMEKSQNEKLQKIKEEVEKKFQDQLDADIAELEEKFDQRQKSMVETMDEKFRQMKEDVEQKFKEQLDAEIAAHEAYQIVKFGRGSTN